MSIVHHGDWVSMTHEYIFCNPSLVSNTYGFHLYNNCNYKISTNPSKTYKMMCNIGHEINLKNFIKKNIIMKPTHTKYKKAPSESKYYNHLIIF